MVSSDLWEMARRPIMVRTEISRKKKKKLLNDWIPMVMVIGSMDNMFIKQILFLFLIFTRRYVFIGRERERD